MPQNHITQIDSKVCNNEGKLINSFKQGHDSIAPFNPSTWPGQYGLECENQQRDLLINHESILTG